MSLPPSLLPLSSSSLTTKDVLYKGNNIDPITVDPPLSLNDEVYSLLQRNKLLSPFLLKHDPPTQSSHKLQQYDNSTELSPGGNMFLYTCVHDIKPVLQRGRPMCGLVALTMASAILNQQCSNCVHRQSSGPLLEECSMRSDGTVHSSLERNEITMKNTIKGDTIDLLKDNNCKENITHQTDHIPSLIEQTTEHLNVSLSLIDIEHSNISSQVDALSHSSQVEHPFLSSKTDHSTTSTCTSINSDPLSLLEYSKLQGYTNQGEIFTSQYLLNIAIENLHCTGRVLYCNDITPLNVIDWLLQGSVLIVPYDCDKDHTPYMGMGHSAHWCLIVGVALPLQSEFDAFDNNWVLYSPSDLLVREYFKSIKVRESITKQPDLFHVFYRHGKSKYMSLCSLESLLTSCDNLYELGPKRNPLDYVLPPDGSLKECLCSKVVLLQK